MRCAGSSMGARITKQCAIALALTPKAYIDGCGLGCTSGFLPRSRKAGSFHRAI